MFPPLPWGGRWLRPQPFSFVSVLFHIRVSMADAAIAIVTVAVAVAVTVAVAIALLAEADAAIGRSTILRLCLKMILTKIRFNSK